MKPFRFGLAALISLIVMFSSPLLAQTKQFVKIELTAPIVEAFLTSMPAIASVADTYADQVPKGDGALGELAGMAVSAKAKTVLDATVKPHGFGDYKTWVIVAQNVMATFVHIKAGDAQVQMSAAMAALQNNPNLTPQQKSMLSAQMGQANTAMTAQRPSDGNIAVVTPLMAKIEATMTAMSNR